MTDSNPALSPAKAGTDAAALSLIDIRRIDRAAAKSAKRGDLTEKLKKKKPPLTGEMPAPPRAVPQAAPVVAPPVVAPVVEPPPFVRRSAPLPEPYFAPEPPPVPEAKAPPPPPAPEIARAAPLPYDDLRSSDALIYYWDELRAGRELPLFSHLDRTRIAISWPDTVMVNYSADHAAMPQITRLSRLTGAIEFTSLVTEWVLSGSRQVARLGKAMETRRTFAGTLGPHNYHMLLLPFADASGVSGHVLCHLSCTD
ncbi:MAG TPA: hypothetical protein VG328_03005 [Stellaceae bacterium]|jgi:hypothetical protein|nr:hypothetical protein [Stellaceae bacterium]